MKRRALAAAALLALAAAACTKKKAEPAASAPAAAPAPAAPAPAPSPEEELVKRGKNVYLANCIACHNSDPHQAGTLGPDVWGSSAELLEARIMRAEYPPGYEPKRKSKAMTPLPHLKADIPALAAYLNKQ